MQNRREFNENKIPKEDLVKTNESISDHSKKISRREFLGSTLATAAAFAIPEISHPKEKKDIKTICTEFINRAHAYNKTVMDNDGKINPDDMHKLLDEKFNCYMKDLDPRTERIIEENFEDEHERIRIKTATLTNFINKKTPNHFIAFARTDATTAIFLSGEIKEVVERHPDADMIDLATSLLESDKEMRDELSKKVSGPYQETHIIDSAPTTILGTIIEQDGEKGREPAVIIRDDAHENKDIDQTVDNEMANILTHRSFTHFLEKKKLKNLDQKLYLDNSGNSYSFRQVSELISNIAQIHKLMEKDGHTELSKTLRSNMLSSVYFSESSDNAGYKMIRDLEAKGLAKMVNEKIDDKFDRAHIEQVAQKVATISDESLKQFYFGNMKKGSDGYYEFDGGLVGNLKNVIEGQSE
jgi:hypothetical protein